MEKLTLPTSMLLLDTDNPRHESVESQRDAILALIDDQGPKLVKLAADIAEYGISPIDRLLVMKHKRNYVVVEGNRRIRWGSGRSALDGIRISWRTGSDEQRVTQPASP